MQPEDQVFHPGAERFQGGVGSTGPHAWYLEGKGRVRVGKHIAPRETNVNAGSSISLKNYTITCIIPHLVVEEAGIDHLQLFRHHYQSLDGFLDLSKRALREGSNKSISFTFLQSKTWLLQVSPYNLKTLLGGYLLIKQ